MAEDIKMNQFQVVTDADYVYVEKGNSQGKIGKSDLISKLLAGNFGFCDLVSVYRNEITVIANNGYGTLIVGNDDISAGQHCIYINETDNKIEFKQRSDTMSVTFGGIIA